MKTATYFFIKEEGDISLYMTDFKDEHCKARNEIKAITEFMGSLMVTLKTLRNGESLRINVAKED